MSNLHGKQGYFWSVAFKGDPMRFLSRWAKLYPDYMDRSIRHVAYLSTMRLKTELLARVPGGVEYPALSKIQRFRILGKLVGPKGNKRRILGPLKARGLAYGMNGYDWPPGGKLAQSIRYNWHKGKMYADIGWLSPNSRHDGILFQKGQKTTVTPKMRKMFAAAGIRLRQGKQTISQPPRPVFEPFFRNRKEWMYNRLIARMSMHIGRAAYDPILANAKNVVYSGINRVKRVVSL